MLLLEIIKEKKQKENQEKKVMAIYNFVYINPISGC
jgi:hypothetical protein